MSYPKTKDEWWASVNLHWDNLVSIIGDQIDLNSMANESPGQSDSPMTGRKVYDELICLKNGRDSNLARYFNGAWHIASENYAWSKPSWGALCDLCSEEHVLYPDGPEEFNG